MSQQPCSDVHLNDTLCGPNYPILFFTIVYMIAKTNVVPLPYPSEAREAVDERQHGGGVAPLAAAGAALHQESAEAVGPLLSVATRMGHFGFFFRLIWLIHRVWRLLNFVTFKILRLATQPSILWSTLCTL